MAHNQLSFVLQYGCQPTRTTILSASPCSYGHLAIPVESEAKLCTIKGQHRTTLLQESSDIACYGLGICKSPLACLLLRLPTLVPKFTGNEEINE